mmetsp:Transcript_16881/g.19439  ORF Transcript_16881/g.19439 Transcript_16881/m.19439 type:complete len:81 (+) Transcript_16881:25-267(+)
MFVIRSIHLLNPTETQTGSLRGKRREEQDHAGQTRPEPRQVPNVVASSLLSPESSLSNKNDCSLSPIRNRLRQHRNGTIS